LSIQPRGSCSSRLRVEAVAEQFGAAPFDIEGVFWSHRGETCTFENGPHAATIEEHTHHPAGSTGSECVACHMPKIA